MIQVEVRRDGKVQETRQIYSVPRQPNTWRPTAHNDDEITDLEPVPPHGSFLRKARRPGC